MNEFDIDKLIGEGLRGGAASGAFRERVLRESTGALLGGRASRNRLRAAGLTLGILLIAAGAFAFGRLSVPGQVIREQENWTNVPRELVAWLDAGRFFEQLGMNERAERAYRMAGELIPQEAAEIMQARLHGDRAYAKGVTNLETVDCSQKVNKLGRFRVAEVRRWNKTEKVNGVLGKVIANYLGG